MAPTWPVASSGNAARLRFGSLRACSELVGLLEIEPQLLHAGAAVEIPARSLGGRRIGADDLLFALPISLLVGQFLLGESIGCAEDDQHSSERQRNHFAGFSHSEHDVLHGLSYDFLSQPSHLDAWLVMRRNCVSYRQSLAYCPSSAPLGLQGKG